MPARAFRLSSRAFAVGLCLVLAWLGACAATNNAPSPQEESPLPENVAAADLVLLGGKIVTVDDELGVVQALACKGGRIVAVGSDTQIRAHIGDATRVIELTGKTAIPGFIEGHGHFTGVGNAQQILDLTSVENWDEVVDMVAGAVSRARPGEWIEGRGWHQEKWNRKPAGQVEGFPTHHSISAVSPDNPVSLRHASGHASFFNAKAMAMAGITAATKNPKGGDILKDKSGEPIGVFRERAAGLMGRARRGRGLRRSPAQREAQLRKTIELADRECLRKGITSFQDAGSTLATVDQFKKMAIAGEIGVRLWVMLRISNGQLATRLAEYRMIDVGDHHLTVRAIKRSIDGALGARGAWLLAPYADKPDSTGHNTASIPSVTRTAELAAQHGYQLCVHAIGDRANREVLDIFDKIFAKREDGNELRWRIEHAQHIHPDDIPRFARLGVIASMQGIHCTSDAPYVLARLGKARAEEGAYVWQKLMQSGAIVTNGTDAPVEDVDPILSYYATVSRRIKDGSVFFADQRMSRIEALKSYTIHAAYAAFEEKDKGTLVPGKLADIVVLSKDILVVPEEEIPQTQVLYTIVGGEVKYEAGKR